VSAGKVGGAARIVLGLLYPRRLQMTYHAAGGGCRNRACQVCSWGFEEAGLDMDTGGRLGRLHIRVHLWWESRWSRRLLVVTGARCPLTKPVVTAVELRVDHRAPWQPRRAARRYLRICRYIASRLPEVWGWAGAGAASASYASYRSDSIYILALTSYNHEAITLAPGTVGAELWRSFSVYGVGPVPEG
jgi:hypothetical protein